MLKINQDKFLLALAKAEMTTTELKTKSKVGRNTISNVMNGKANIRPSIVGKLAKALDVEVEEIIDIEK